MFRQLIATVVLVGALPASFAQSFPAGGQPADFVLVVHGGAGAINRQNINAETEANYRAGLERALRSGYKVLENGGSSTDAVVAAVRAFEDDPLFNAGKGSVFTHDGKNEMDASIMDGRSGLAGAVAGVSRIRNPITAARAVMDHTRHVMLIGQGAEQFAAAQGLEMVDPAYFFTQWRWDQLQRARQQQSIELDHQNRPAPVPAGKLSDAAVPYWQTDYKYGTVGAVALDKNGNLAAATSTGGMTNKMSGRVGDSPVIGAGTFADNQTAAISCTGTGEFFMRSLVAYDVTARIKYQHLNLSEAVDQTLQQSVDDKRGEGGLIALDAKGNIKFGMNTDGMYRGYVRSGEQPVVMLFR